MNQIRSQAERPGVTEQGLAAWGGLDDAAHGSRRQRPVDPS